MDPGVVKRFRFYYAQVRWRKAILAVMAFNRLGKSMARIRKRNAAATKLQRVARGRLARRRYRALLKGAITAQRVFRGGVGRRKAAKRRAEVIAEAQRQAELARKRADEEAAARAAKAEREAREAEERMRKEQEDSALAAEAALAKQAEERQQELLAMIRMRRKSSVAGGLLRRSTTVQQNPEDGSVSVRAGGRLRVSTTGGPPHTSATRSKSPSIGVMLRIGETKEDAAMKRVKSGRIDDASKRRVQRRQAARRATSIQRGGLEGLRQVEGKSASEKLATLKREEFGIPCMGDCQVLSQTTLPGRKLLGVITLKRPSFRQVWQPRYYVIDKPKRSLVLFESAAKRKQISRVALSKDTVVTPYAGRAHALQVGGSVDAIVLALASELELAAWRRDLKEAMMGFRTVGAQAPDEDFGDDDGGDNGMGDAARAVRVVQLQVLLRQGRITQKEFDEACEDVAKTGQGGGGDDDDDDLVLEEYGAQVACRRCGTSNNTSFGNFTCIKCYADLPRVDTAQVVTNGSDLGIKPDALSKAIFSDVAYDLGRLSCGMGGVEKRMDLRTYEEVEVCVLQVRFRDEHEADLEIGWTVSHSLDKLRAFADSLAGKQSPLVSADAKKVPKPPAALSEQAVGDWLKALIALLPPSSSSSSDEPANAEGDTTTGLNDDGDDEEVLVAAAWRSVKDPVSGDVYYYNKRTGETTWDDPFPGQAPPLPPKPTLPAGWCVLVVVACGAHVA